MSCRLWEATAAELRQWADDYGRQLEAASDAEDRKRLRKVRRALLDLADNEDWLAGRRQQERGRQSTVQNAPESVSA
ncbi:MAG: hypothetical protein K2X60_08230 [Xanthobacteraceae bacterium]|nr:hypothetical protein [Xanthobacteraceae bacterium]